MKLYLFYAYLIGYGIWVQSAYRKAIKDFEKVVEEGKVDKLQEDAIFLKAMLVGLFYPIVVSSALLDFSVWVICDLICGPIVDVYVKIRRKLNAR